MNLRVDTSKCTGIGNCEMAAPDIFEIGEDGQAHVLKDDPSGQDLTDAKRAIAECPTEALAID